MHEESGLFTRAGVIAEALKKADYAVPPIQLLGTGPSANELRFFRQAERAKAEDIARAVEQSGEDKSASLTWTALRTQQEFAKTTSNCGWRPATFCQDSCNS